MIAISLLIAVSANAQDAQDQAGIQRVSDEGPTQRQRQDVMADIRATEDPDEQQALMEEHMQDMQNCMEMPMPQGGMHGHMEGRGMGRMEMGMDEAMMRRCRRMMEQHMGMMNEMMGEMEEEQAAEAMQDSAQQ